MKESKTYKIKEIFYSIQGEGYHSGRPAVFCRFSGCNLWSGREEDRSDAICSWCDTDFRGTDGENGGNYSASELVEMIFKVWNNKNILPFIVLTGGEPLLQVDSALIKVIKEANIYIALETNGTLPCPEGIDWICVSPKIKSELVQANGNELKLVYPQKDADPMNYLNLKFDHFSMQPLDDQNYIINRQVCMEYCLANPKWHLSLQTHKILGVK